MKKFASVISSLVAATALSSGVAQAHDFWTPDGTWNISFSGMYFEQSPGITCNANFTLVVSGGQAAITAGSFSGGPGCGTVVRPDSASFPWNVDAVAHDGPPATNVDVVIRGMRVISLGGYCQGDMTGVKFYPGSQEFEFSYGTSVMDGWISGVYDDCTADGIGNVTPVSPTTSPLGVS